MLFWQKNIGERLHRDKHTARPQDYKPRIMHYSKEIIR